MPLTPAEVHNVAFKKPPIGKRGYDEEEVDAFLDIVEVELSRLIEENNDLRAERQRCARAGARRVGVRAVDDGGAAPAELAAARDENRRLQAHIGELERALSQGKDAAAAAGRAAAAAAGADRAATRRDPPAARAGAADRRGAGRRSRPRRQPQPRSRRRQRRAPTTAEHHAQAVQVLALAQQTADQHLAQSKAEAERLLTEAQATRRRAPHRRAAASRQQHVAEAQARAKQLDEESTRPRNQQTVRTPSSGRRHDHRAVRAAQGRARAAGRGAAHLRARVPHPAQELPRVAAA